MAKFQNGDLVIKNKGDYQFIGEVVGVFLKRSGITRYNVEDGRGCVHIFNEDQLEPWKETFYYKDSIEGQIALAVQMCSSPTMGSHLGDKQTGYIIWSRDGMPHLVAQLLKIMTAKELVDRKDRRIQELLEQNAKLHYANQELRQGLHGTVNGRCDGPSQDPNARRYCASEDETRL